MPSGVTSGLPKNRYAASSSELVNALGKLFEGSIASLPVIAASRSRNRASGNDACVISDTSDEMVSRSSMASRDHADAGAARENRGPFRQLFHHGTLPPGL